MTSKKLVNQVSRLLTKHMRDDERFDEPHLERALEIWEIFHQRIKLRRTPKHYAAGVEYALVNEAGIKKTQAEIGRVYGVNRTLVSSESMMIREVLRESSLRREASEAREPEDLLSLLIRSLADPTPQETPIDSTPAIPSTYRDPHGVYSPLMPILLEATHQLWLLEPWILFSPGRLFEIEVVGERSFYLQVTSHLFEGIGVTVFDHHPDATTRRTSSSRTPAKSSTTRKLNFFREDDLPSRMLEELEEQRWPAPASGIYPMLLEARGGGADTRLEANDYTIMAYCIAGFVALIEDMLGYGEEESDEEEVEVRIGDARVRARPMM